MSQSQYNPETLPTDQNPAPEYISNNPLDLEGIDMDELQDFRQSSRVTPPKYVPVLYIGEDNVEDNATTKPVPTKQRGREDPMKQKKKRKEGPPNPKTSGFYPNLVCFRLKRIFLEKGKRYMPLENPIKLTKLLLEEIGIKNTYDTVSIKVLNEIYPHMKQRSDAWFIARSEIKSISVSDPNPKGLKSIIGASAISDACGLWCKLALKFFKGENYAKTYGSNAGFVYAIQGNSKPFDRMGRLRTTWGALKEKDALISVIQNIPQYRVYAFGSLLLPLTIPPTNPDGSDPTPEQIKNWLIDQDRNPTVEPVAIALISPDGIIEDIETGEIFVLELKCPCPWSVTKGLSRFSFFDRGFYDMQPHYYTLQTLLQAIVVMLFCLREGYKLAEIPIVFASYTPQYGVRIFRFQINYTLYYLMVKVYLWAHSRYKNNKILLSSVEEPFEECPFYEAFINELNTTLSSSTDLKDYEIDPLWVIPEFQQLFFDVDRAPDGSASKDGRKRMGKEGKIFENCSCELVPPDEEDEDISQATLLEYFKLA